MVLTCPYGPDIEDITLEKDEKLSNTPSQFLLWTPEITYTLNRVILITVVKCFQI